jgi:hypothetical protein
MQTLMVDRESFALLRSKVSKSCKPFSCTPFNLGIEFSNAGFCKVVEEELDRFDASLVGDFFPPPQRRSLIQATCARFFY